MNLAELQQRLLAAARATPIRDTVPYAFEKRILARLADRAGFDAWALWNHILWRAVSPCLAVVVIMGVWTFFRPVASTEDALVADLESAVYSPLDNLSNTW
jgi:hypothetical protein